MSVSKQPGKHGTSEVTWMQPIGRVADCPPGLEYLTQLDQVIIQKEVNLVEVLLSWQCNNKYRVMNSMRQQCYFAAEKTGTLMRLCCGPSRGFTIHITDNNGQEVFRVRREFKCCGGCCCCADMDCAAHEVIVETPQGQLLGYVRQLQSKWKPHFGIFNAKREQQMEIWGPCCTCQGLCCRSDVDFPAVSVKDGSVVSTISKQWSGAVKEIFTDADTFSVTFPLDLSVDVKAVLMGAVFLIYYMFYEYDEKNDYD